jgi:hypothetical protein
VSYSVLQCPTVLRDTSLASNGLRREGWNYCRRCANVSQAVREGVATGRLLGTSRAPGLPLDSGYRGSYQGSYFVIIHPATHLHFMYFLICYIL